MVLWWWCWRSWCTSTFNTTTIIPSLKICVLWWLMKLVLMFSLALRVVQRHTVGFTGTAGTMFSQVSHNHPSWLPNQMISLILILGSRNIAQQCATTILVITGLSPSLLGLKHAGGTGGIWDLTIGKRCNEILKNTERPCPGHTLLNWAQCYVSVLSWNHKPIQVKILKSS